MRVRLYFLKTDKEGIIQNAEKIDENRWASIENYMLIDAGVKPVKDGFVAYIINEEEWKDGPRDFVEKAKVVEENSDEFITEAILIERDSYTKIPSDNEGLVHEVLGHVGFDKHISLRDDYDARRVSEAFARTLGLFVNEERSCSIADTRNGELKRLYPDGTTRLTERAFEIYSRAGKKAIVSLFYSTSPESLDNPSLNSGNTLIDRIYEDEELLRAIAVLSARYSGRYVGNLLRVNMREDLIRKAREVYDETASNSSDVSEQDLMFRHLKEEFSLGDSFTELYLRDVKPSCLDELIENKNVPVIDRASELKWIYAHAGTNSPDHRRGLCVLNHFMRTAKKITDLNGSEQEPQFQHDVMVAYNKVYGNGDDLERNFKRFGVSYKDINGLFSKEKVPYVIAKRGILFALTYPFRRKAQSQ